jgi:hypothetical protein
VWLATTVMVSTSSAGAQPLGSFTWQLQPFCNRVTVTVTQNGGIYTLDGTDDQCGAAQKASLVGLAAPNPDGSIGFGLNIVAPSGQPVPVQARISIATLSGTWTDSGGNSGTFAFGGALPGLPPRPLPTLPGDITGVTTSGGLTGGASAGEVALGVDSAVLQRRVGTACPAGQAIRSINQDGTVACQAATGTGGGDITAVNPGPGLLGGGDTGDLLLAVQFDGDGVVPHAARSDHEHLHNASSVGVGTLALAGTGVQNVGVGVRALRFADEGSNNTAVGYEAAQGAADALGVTAVGALALRQTTASGNTGVGFQAGRNTTTGQDNTAVGASALLSNVLGSNNVAVGPSALRLAGTGNNTAVGAFALDAATSGTFNTALGQSTFSNLTTGSNNTALGNEAGAVLTTGSRVTLVGDNAEVGSGAASNATAVGANALVEQDNSLVLGSIDGLNGATADTRVGIGTTSPDAALEVAMRGSILQSSYLNLALTRYGGPPAVLLFRSAFGTEDAPQPSGANDDLGRVQFMGRDANGWEVGAQVVAEAAESWTNTTHGTSLSFHTAAAGSDSTAARLVIDRDGQVGIGTTNPDAQLHVAGTLRVDNFATGGGNQVCRNDANQLAFCSSSLRYKREVRDYAEGLNVLSRLRPISFTWKNSGATDLGFGAEDVAAIDPRLAVFDDDGTVEGVKYDRLTTVLVNAVKELAATNAVLERRLNELEALLRASPPTRQK